MTHDSVIGKLQRRLGTGLALMTKIGSWQTVGKPALSSTLSIVDTSQ